MKLELKNRQQLLAVVAIGLVAVWIGDRLLFTPLGAAWKDRADQVAKTRKDFVQGTQLLKREQTLETRWQDMAAGLLSNDVSAAQSQLCGSLYRWAQERRVVITSIKPAWRRPEPDHATLECRVEASGNLGALTQFLYDVERGQIALRVEDVELSSRDDSGQQLTLNLQLSGLVLKPKQTL
jgi:hypothetical protein